MLNETRVLGVTSQDVMMDDSGRQGRPPGDPPDIPDSWARKLVGSSGGGMRRPDDVLDEKFVAERVTLEFPDGVDGEPVITIGTDVLEAMNDLWKQCMIVKVLGRNVPLMALHRRLKELWKPKGAMVVMDLPRQYFMIRFGEEEDYMDALTGGPLIQLKDDITTTPVWSAYLDLPVNFYHKAILFGIAKGVGKPIRVDATTSNLERARFARVCVEVNLKKPLKGIIQYLFGCGLYGHMIHTCPSSARAREPMSAPRAQSTVAEMHPGQVEDGYTQMKRSVAAKGQRGNVNLGGRDSRLEKNMENITVSNSFERLREDLDSVNPQNRDVNVERASQTGLVVFEAGPLKPIAGNQGNGKWRKNGPTKTNNRVQTQAKMKPVRGLVYGPTHQDSELSSTGKRMRVQPGDVGRSRGCFANENLVSGKESQHEQAKGMETPLVSTVAVEHTECTEKLGHSEMELEVRENLE
ncbi:hypothetical protein Bca52824_042773 [Brassica carinata]|uniref:DUF4283 domain-containing protein n=1 Tax=Brassica carinata TaxID=52824 RepID=A0A8X7RVW9_BRACI|nr:hypothetical protein Bca52824_042773 [Brassica carinata]